MPRFAVMTFMFRPWLKEGRISLADMLAGFAAAGAEGIEPFHTDFVDAPQATREYRDLLAAHNLKTAAVDIMCNLVYADSTQRQAGRDQLRKGLDIAQELGADIAHVAGHCLVEGVTPGDGRKMIAAGLAEVADIARAGGMTLAIENFNPSPDLVCKAEDCLEIMRLAGDDLRFVLDTGNFIAVDEDPQRNFDAVAERICHCHFKDFKADPEHPKGYQSCDLGTGDIPNSAVAAQLIARGYDGWVALETYGRKTVDPVSAVALEIPVLQSWFQR